MKLTAFIIGFDSECACWRVYGYDGEGREMCHCKEYRSEDAAIAAADWYHRAVIGIVADEWKYVI